MYIELESVFNREGESVRFDYSYSIDCDDNITSPVKVSGSVFNKTGIVHLAAVAEYEYSTACALCNKPLLRHAKVQINHVLIAHLNNEDDDLFIVVENMRLNLDDLVSEDIFLSVPSRFLCKPDCKGLCSMCGADLNETECNCKKPVDSRWAALTDLLN